MFDESNDYNLTQNLNDETLKVEVLLSVKTLTNSRMPEEEVSNFTWNVVSFKNSIILI